MDGIERFGWRPRQGQAVIIWRSCVTRILKTRQEMRTMACVPAKVVL